MNVKQTVKRMSAVLAGAAMIGATVMGAMAYDLSNYPQPFVVNGAFNGKIVVGTNGPNAAGLANDMLGAVDIAASLQAAAKTPVSVSGGTVTVAGGDSQDVIVGNDLSSASGFGATIDHTDAAFLADSTTDISIGDVSNSYNYQEQILFDNSPSFNTTLTTGLAFRQTDDYGDKYFMTAGQNSIEYLYKFTEDLKAGNFITNATSDAPIELNFLGKTLRITGATATSMTVDVASEYYLGVGDSVTVDGHKVELVDVSSDGNTVIVKVDGVTGTVTTSTKSVNGENIKVKTGFSSNTKSERSATIYIGNEITKTYNNNDAFIGQDDNKPEWVWDLADLNTAQPTIGVKFKADLDKDSGEGYANYDSVIYQGDSITFPNNFAKVTFDSLNQNAWSDYSVDTDTVDLYEASTNTTPLYTSIKAVKIQSDKDNSGLIVGSNQKTDTVYLVPDQTNSSAVAVYYKDSSNGRAVFENNMTSGTLFKVDYSKTSVPVALSGYTTAGGNLTFSIGTASPENLTMAFTASGAATGGEVSYLGLTDQTTDDGLWYGAGSTISSISGLQSDLSMNHGVKIGDPDSEFQKSSGTLSLSFPGDVNDFRANMVLSGSGTTTTTSSSDTGAYKVNAIPVGLAVLDKDAESLIGTEPMIVVGGPYVNSVAAQLMGNPTDAQIQSMFQAGKAKIKLYADSNAILVAGYAAQDTLGAAYVLADYGSYSLTGSEVEVLVPSLSDISVQEPSLPPASADNTTA